MTRWPLHLLAGALLLLTAVATAACEEGPEPEVETGVRRETQGVLEELRTELDREITPERKQELVDRCTDATERLRDADDPEADRLANFCDSLEDTDPNTPAAWDDIRARLDELIDRFRA